MCSGGDGTSSSAAADGVPETRQAAVSAVADMTQSNGLVRKRAGGNSISEILERSFRTGVPNRQFLQAQNRGRRGPRGAVDLGERDPRTARHLTIARLAAQLTHQFVYLAQP